MQKFLGFLDLTHGVVIVGLTKTGISGSIDFLVGLLWVVYTFYSKESGWDIIRFLIRGDDEPAAAYKIHSWLIALYLFFVVHTNYSVNLITGALQRERIVVSRFIYADAIFTVLMLGATCYACVLAANVKDDYTYFLAIAFAVISVAQAFIFHSVFVFWKELKFLSRNSSHL